jgi:hypothetical protein
MSNSIYADFQPLIESGYIRTKEKRTSAGTLMPRREYGDYEKCAPGEMKNRRLPCDRQRLITSEHTLVWVEWVRLIRTCCVAIAR